MRLLKQAIAGAAIFSAAAFAGTHIPEAKASGFQAGNDLKRVNLSGNLTVICQDPKTLQQIGFAVLSCQQETLTPTDEDYFVSSLDVRAKDVTLKSFHEDGSNASQTVRYQASKQRSKDPIALWSYIDRLIEFGINTITMTYLDPQGAIVSQGQDTFSVNVAAGDARTCQSRTVVSNTLSDCQGGGERLCPSYFSNENLCQYGSDGLPDII